LRIAAAITLAFLLPVTALPVVETKKPASKKSAAKKTAARKTSGSAKRTTSAVKGKKPAASTVAKKGTGKRSKTALKNTRQTWRARQQAPTPDRYKQIQEALAAKGYLNATPSGVWNGESAEALRRFQSEQNLEPTGKLNSLSLIALGLGPKRETASVVQAAPR
jgi:hypothetical protein